MGSGKVRASGNVLTMGPMDSRTGNTKECGKWSRPIVRIRNAESDVFWHLARKFTCSSCNDQRWYDIDYLAQHISLFYHAPRMNLRF